MADPVSWYLVERGWRVVDASGAELGEVSAVIGDENADIFDGLHVKTAAGERYVPGDRVGPIEEGLVTVAGRLEPTPAVDEPGGAEVSLDPELARTVRARFEKAAERGHGDADMAAVHEAWL